MRPRCSAVARGASSRSSAELGAPAQCKRPRGRPSSSVDAIGATACAIRPTHRSRPRFKTVLPVEPSAVAGTQPRELGVVDRLLAVLECA